MFKDLMNVREPDSTMFLQELKEHFYPQAGFSAVYKFCMPEARLPLILNVNGTEMECYYGDVAAFDVEMQVSSAIMEDIVQGRMTFQKDLNEYANLSLAVTGLDGRPAVAELLSRQDAPVRRVPVIDGHAVFSNITPGDYFARLFIDANGNGKYDTGILDSIQPEEVYYYPKKIALKKNWDVDQTWDINELPIDQQKPMEIKKNKPKNSTGPQEDEYEDDQYYDEFGNPAVDPDDPFGKRKGKNRDSNYNRNTSFGGGGLNGNSGFGTGGRMRGGGVYR